MSRLVLAAQGILRKCLGVKPGETVLVVTDRELTEIGELLWREATGVGADSVLLKMVPRTVHGEEPPHIIAAAMKAAGVVLAPTSRSLSHTQARREATQAGARIATLPGITGEIMARAIPVDYDKLQVVTEKLARLLTDAHEARITTSSGTELVLDLRDRRGLADTGVLTRPGDFGNLPAGEAFIAPLEGTASGTVVVNGSIGGLGLLEEPVELVIRDGVVMDIKGNRAARALRELLSAFGDGAGSIGEFGIGTNENALLSGNILEDEKVVGTVHIALGNNAGFGGKISVPLHLDGIILGPTVVLDGEEILTDGVLACSAGSGAP